MMIAEDQTMVRQALVALLELENDIEVVAEAADGAEALAMARKHQPDVVVLDIEMPGPSGIEVASQLTDREGEVLAAAAGHDAIADIAARLHLSPGPVRNHLSAAIQKLGARSRAEAVAIAQQKGWL
jgi:DNA-binding NarL/FixJ family response regulator